MSCDVVPARPFADDPVLWVANVAHYEAGRYFVGAFDVPTTLALRPAEGRVFDAECTRTTELTLQSSEPLVVSANREA